jgi:hypothetical protein
MARKLHRTYRMDGGSHGMFEQDWMLNSQNYKLFSYVRKMGITRQIRAMDYLDSQCYNSIKVFKVRKKR